MDLRPFEQNELRAKDAQIVVLEQRISALEAENKHLWGAMHATGDLFRKLLTEDE